MRWLGAGGYGKVILARVHTRQHPAGRLIAIKKTLNTRERSVAQFHAEQRASTHSRRVQNCYAMQFLCPLIASPTGRSLCLAMEYMPRGDLYNLLASLEEHSESMRSGAKPHYPVFQGVHTAAARLVAAEFMVFFESADRTAEPESGVEGSKEAAGPFLALDIKLDNVLVTESGSIRVRTSL